MKNAATNTRKHNHLERVLIILEMVSNAVSEPNTNEICKATGLPAPTVYRLVREMCDSGLLQSNIDRRYSLGQRLKQMVVPQRSDRDFAQIAKPVLQTAANKHSAAFFLSVARGRGVEIIDVQTPRDGKVSYLHPGLGFRPVHACSCAKAIAAFSEHGLGAQSLHGELRAYTEFTQTDSADVQCEFERIRKQGYAECLQEVELGVCSVAAPVLDTNNNCVFSVGATGSVRLFTDEFREKLGSTLVELARDLSQNLRGEIFISNSSTSVITAAK